MSQSSSSAENSYQPKRKGYYSYVNKGHNYPLFRYEDLPDWGKHNPSIVGSYRPGLSTIQAFFSLFKYHNESFNIWTHLLGALLFTGLMFYSLFTWLDAGTFLDKSLFLAFVLSAQILLTCSSCFHLFNCISRNPNEYSWFARLDYIGIAILIAGSYYAPIFYLFSCQPLLGLFFNGGITLFALLSIIATFHPLFEKPGYAGVRAALYLFMGFFCVTCFPFVLYYNDFSVIWPVLWRCGIMGGCFCIGVVFYVSQFPESVFPGRVDCFLHSHMIWHIWVVAGTFAQYFVCYYCFHNIPTCNF